MDTVLWLCPSQINETLKWISSLPIFMQESFWWWQCSSSSIYIYIYMGSSSVLVLIGSHSLCNSFVVNQFLFFTPNGENSLCYTPKKQWEQYGGKKMFCLFFISKIYSHVTQKWRPKTGMAIPYCSCWKLLHTRRKYSDVSNLFAKLQHAKAPES